MFPEVLSSSDVDLRLERENQDRKSDLNVCKMLIIMLFNILPIWVHLCCVITWFLNGGGPGGRSHNLGGALGTGFSFSFFRGGGF